MMSKKFLFFILIFSFLQIPAGFSYEIVGEHVAQNAKRIKPQDVSRVEFRMFEKDAKRYEGYIAFYVGGGENGVVSSPYKAIVWVGKNVSEPTRADKMDFDYFKEISVNPSHFKVIKLDTGQTLIAIPIKPFRFDYQKAGSEAMLSSGAEPEEKPNFRFYWRSAVSDYAREWREASVPQERD